MPNAKPLPKNAVVDASVLVSAFLFPESTPGRVLSIADKGVYALHYSLILLEETKRSLRNPKLTTPYGYGDDAIEAWCAFLRETGFLLTAPLPDIGAVCRDPDDDHVIAAAVAVKAERIATGDRDLLDLGRYKDIRIVTARSFLDELGEM